MQLATATWSRCACALPWRRRASLYACSMPDGWLVFNWRYAFHLRATVYLFIDTQRETAVSRAKRQKVFVFIVFNVGRRRGSRMSQKTSCHSRLADDCLLQHSTRTEAERTSSSLNKQGKRGALPRHNCLSTSVPQVLQKNSLNALLACCSSPITTPYCRSPFHDGRGIQKK